MVEQGSVMANLQTARITGKKYTCVHAASIMIGYLHIYTVIYTRIYIAHIISAYKSTQRWMLPFETYLFPNLSTFINLETDDIWNTNGGH